MKCEHLSGHCHCCCSGWKVSGFFASLHTDICSCSSQQFRVSVGLIRWASSASAVGIGGAGVELVLGVFSEFQEGKEESE